jgi:HEAT repeat protein
MGKAAASGGAKMNRVIFLILFFIFFLNPANAYPTNQPRFINEWLHLLKTGNERGKKLALANLWFLKYPENRKDIAVFEPILTALKDENPFVREAAAEALCGVEGTSKTEKEKIILSLLSALEDHSPRVREGVVKALGRFGWREKQVIGALIHKLRDPSSWVRINAAYSLGEIKAQEAVDPLLELLEESSDWRFKYVQQEALIALRKIGVLNKRLIAVTEKNFHDEYLKVETIKIIGQLKIVEARDLLVTAARDPHEVVRKKALNSIYQLTLISRPQIPVALPPKVMGDPFVEILTKSLRDRSAEIRAQSAEALGKIQDPRAVEPLMDALKDTSALVKNNAMKALGNFSEERIFDVVIHYLQTDPNVLHNHLSEDTFISVARKTSRSRAYSYFSEGKHHLQTSLVGIQQGASYRELIVHPNAVQKLLQALENSTPRIQERIFQMLGFFADDRIEGYLLRYLESPSAQVRRRAASGLEIFGGAQAFPKLLNMLKDQDPEVKAAAATTLGAFKDKRALEPLVELLRDPNERVREAALRSLGGFNEKKVLDLMIDHLENNATSIRNVAIRYLREPPDPRAVEPLSALLGHEDSFLPLMAAEVLGKIGDKRALQLLKEVLNGQYDRNRQFDADKKLRNTAALALGSLRAREAVPVLISALQNKDLKVSAIIALGSVKDEAAVPALIKCLSDEDPMAQERAALALKEIGTPRALAAVQNYSKDKPYSAVNLPRIGSSIPVDSSKIPRPAGPIKKGELGYAVGGIQRPEGPPQKLSPPAVDIRPFLDQLKAQDPRTRSEAAFRLGGIGNPEAAEHLLPLLQDENARVKSGAAYALGNMKEKRAVEQLLTLLRDPDQGVRVASITALGRIGDARAIEPISFLLHDGNKEIRYLSAGALRSFPDSRGMRVLINQLVENTRRGDRDSEKMLGEITNRDGGKALLQALADPGGNERQTLRNYIRHMGYNIPYVSEISREALADYKDLNLLIAELAFHIRSEKSPYYAIAFLGQMKDPKGVSTFSDVLKNRKAYSGMAVVGAMDALKDFGGEQTPKILLDILRDLKESDIVREHAARTLGRTGGRQVTDALIGVLKNKQDAKEVRTQAAAGLGELKDQKAVPFLIEVLKDKGEDDWVRAAAAVSLSELGDEKAIGPILLPT